MRTLKDIAAQYAKKQPQQVDTLTEEAPILARIPFIEASHDLWNLYEEVTHVTGAGFVDMNAPLPTVDVGSSLQKVDLAILGGEIEVPEDTATLFGGHQKYFAKMMPKILRRSGMTAEHRILYDNFRKYAIDEKNLIYAGGKEKELTSILAIRFVEGETSGLFSPKCFQKGDILNTTAINNGALYKSTSKNHSNVLVYGLRMKAYLGIQIANRDTVSAIVNISKDAVPTPTMIDDLLANVRAQPSNTILCMHEKMRTTLLRHKADSMYISAEQTDVNRYITHWNGIPVITSYTFSLEEDEVSIQK